ncbi:MAG: UDP-N-acetylmuramoyl-tripeptide--D-alanyl-D-alanine ligase [Nitrospinae bacterium]|nr:UDP-N-acetylmuramoyl-tripeptide--D-alanyl-D-alanine ligase [Nitrospinota bacterium]
MAAVFSANEITTAVKGRLLHGDGSARAAGVSTDTRTLEAGELFIALKGPNFDGAQFLAQAMEKNAAGVVVEQGAEVPDGDATFVVEVPDTLKALGDLARAHRSRFEIPMVGVTGSNGKTTTKEMIAGLLSTSGETCKSEGNLNNLVGLPHQVLRLGEEHDNAVFEMGMSEPGEIRRLAEIVRPQIAVITNVGPAHIEGLGSVEAVRDAKGEILENIPPGGVAVLSNEDPHSRVLAERHEAKGGRVIRFGFSPQSDFWADEIYISSEGAQFMLHCPGGESGVRLKALGRHNVLNALAAAASASELDIGLDEMADGLSQAVLPKMRFQVREIAGREGVHLLDDSYNANPESVAQAVETASAIRGDGRLISVLGDMAELGPLAERAHREVGRKLAASSVDLFVGVGPLMRLASDEARLAGMDGARIMNFDTPNQAASSLAGTLIPGDWVLVKGSRSMMMERVIEGLEI